MNKDDERPVNAGPVRACLDELGRSNDPGAAMRVAADHGSALLGTPGAASELVAAVARTASTDRGGPLELFEALIGLARMDTENRGRLGESFLTEAHGATGALAVDGGLDERSAHGLARAYARAEIEAPEALVSFLTAQLEALAASDRLPGDLDAEIDRLRREAGDDDYMLHMVLDDMLGVLPDEVRPALVHHVSGRDEGFSGRMALYWLLDASREVRLAAAGALAGRARRGILDAASVAVLPLIRNWMPPDGARPVLDAALREARQRNLSGPPERPGGRPKRLLGTLPDGSGAQSLAAVLDGPVTALVLIKAGHGVKDAFLARGDAAGEAISTQVDDIGALDLAWEAFETALAAALANGLAAGRPPPAGLIDAALACGLGELRPRPMAAGDWLAEVDPEGEIAGLPARERERLIARSATWPDDHPIVDTWFEGTAVFDEALKSASGTRQPEAAFWERLEERRGDWALLMLRAAHILKASGGDGEWRSFAAAASALLDGRALKTIPIMDYVFDTSVEAWEAEEHELGADDADGLTDVAGAGTGPEEELWATASPAWLDGYLSAAALAPLTLRPGAGLSALAERIRDRDDKALETFIALATGRYNELTIGLGESRFAAAMLAGLDDGDLMAWARGFIQGARVLEDDWPQRDLQADDRRTLSLLAALAGGEPPGEIARAVLAGFIGRRFAMRHEGRRTPDVRE